MFSLCFQKRQFYQEREFLCNTDYEAFGNVVGTVEAVANPVLEYEKKWLTSIAVTTTGAHTVAILGTGDGFIKKVLDNNFL